MNFFFAIIAKVRNQGTSKLSFDTNEIKELVDFSQKDDKRWQEIMRNCAKKVTQLTYFEDDGKRFEVMTLFSRFVVDYEKKIVEVEDGLQMKNVLKLENVTMQFGGVVAVDNLNMEDGADHLPVRPVPVAHRDGGALRRLAVVGPAVLGQEEVGSARGQVGRGEGEIGRASCRERV